MRTKDMTPYKKKKVYDLIRYIRNSADTEVGSRSMLTPNYSILLGAGASRTSGIRTGGQLINQWKEEIYRDHNDDDSLSIDDYFKSEKVADWFEENTAYSCLFEERFDLQRQRRVFVENEVSGKTPSIGYAYLVRLIEKGFFNTVFTTNFDDLLNEAFYRFSKNRPIVCAHDSSISGVTITSSRPKIIKLHGDYLFDNIKATQRETESLETNMRMKFEEFAKDFGLIVVGYSGGDRSIMDIISELLRSKEYFKNGIYWCVKKGENDFHPELRKLLNRDRVFLVEIEGFDELFAELNHHLNNGSLPIDDSFLGFKYQDQIISDLTDNKYLNLECKYLADDCKRLKSGVENNRYRELLKTVVKQKSGFNEKEEKTRARRKTYFPKMTSEEKGELNNMVFEAFFEDNKEDVLEELSKKNILSLKDNQYKIELLEFQSDLIENMTDEEVKKYFDELIRLNPDKIIYYVVAANRSTDYSQKFWYFEQALKRFPNNRRLINSYVDNLLDYCADAININDCENELNNIKVLIDQSLDLYKSIDNSAYEYKLRWINIRYSNDTQKKNNETDSLCNEVNKLSPIHPTTIKILREAHFKGFSETNIQDALNFYEKANYPESIEQIYMEHIKFLLEESSIEDIIKSFSDFEDRYYGSDIYKMFKTDTIAKYEYFDDALMILKSLPKNKVTIKKIMMILKYLDKGEEIEKLYESLSKSERLELQKDYYEMSKQYGKLNELYYQKIKGKEYLDKNDIITYAYALLKEEKYDEVRQLLDPYCNNTCSTDPVVLVNYMYASLQCGMPRNKVDKKLKEKIINDKYGFASDFEKLGAACVIGNESEIKIYLERVLRKCPNNKYIIKDWPIIQPYISNKAIATLLTPDPKFL